MFGRRCFLWIALSCSVAVSAYSQTKQTPNPANTTFKAKTQVVVEDVVVTDRKGDPVSGLQKGDFQVFEEGKPQTVLSFEEHKGASEQPLPPLPPDIFTNYPGTRPADSLNVLLLDDLNTPLSDQAKIHLQLANFLKSIPPGSHIAMFLLSSHLFMTQGFTADPSILETALKKKNRPQSSLLLGLSPVDNLDARINRQMAVTGAGMPSATIASTEKLQAFENQTQNSQDRLRMTQTLDAMQGLATYLTGIPGRKNVIWFSDAFPLSIIPGRGVQSYESTLPDQSELRKTVNMLAAAQVAIYPISAGGLDQKFITNESRIKSVAEGSARTVQGQQISEVTAPHWDGDEAMRDQDYLEHDRRFATLTTMVEFARDTGGEAFYNTNGIQQALAHAMSEGAHYYTISYSPTDQRADGHYRPIEVKLAKGNYRLAYRHGYFATDEQQKKDAAQPGPDPLRPFLIAGLPDAAQIVYKVRVLPLPLPEHGSKAANADRKMHLQGPLKRYGIDFAILLPDLGLTLTDGLRKGKLEVAVVAYDQNGIPLNSVIQTADISLTQALYGAYAKTGVPIHEEIDVPRGGVSLRTGICDLATNRAGTIEIPLNQIVATASEPNGQ